MPTNACTNWILGDLDNTGGLSVIDVLLLTDLVNYSISGLCLGSISDINNDGQLSIVDIEFLVSILMNQ